MPLKRSDDYRYTVELAGSDITPLAAVEVHIGEQSVRVLNISQGGMALLFDQAPALEVGQLLDLSVSIRGRPFAVPVEIKATRERRASCAFVNAPRPFQGALRAFLQPKFLGANLRRSLELSGRQDVLDLVEGAQHYDVFLGDNQTGVFVWTGAERALLRMVCVSRDLMFEWTPEAGLRTGRTPGGPGSEVTWDRTPEMPAIHYFADILISWLQGPEGVDFVDLITLDAPGEEPIRFPRI
jgi:hypothetical protein